MSLANFYICTSDSRVMDKVLSATHEKVEVKFIENVDTLDPVLKISKNIDSNTYNYVYLSETGKYYFLSKPPIFKEGFYEVPLHEDVLYTLRGEIRRQSAIIERNQYDFNLYQNDPKMKLYSYEAVRTVEFPGGFNFNTQQFVMGVVGSQIFEDK